jgi:hypothetical protein
MDQKYPQGLASNCFALVGPTQGLYLGSHDPTFEDTGHGLRLYPSGKFNFDQLECGIYKYPNCLSGDTWTCRANVLVPYSGDWHATGKIYRAWADTWWRLQEPPQWVKEMKGWQRFIVKHQYGEQLFTYADSRTFTVADVRQPKWQAVLHKFVDQAVEYGAKSVFFDQMGSGDKPHWDLSRESAVPNLRTAADKATLITALREHVRSRGSDLALGVELLADVIANRSDYVHARYGATDVLNRDWEARKEKPRTNNFIDWFRYTFPEVILSDRDLRDDSDVQRRVNHTVLKGLRNDVEIYRCRGLIDETPTYFAHLTQVNRLKERFKDLLLVGRYTDTEGFTHSNSEIDARRFENGSRAAIVLAQPSSWRQKARTS